MFAGLFDSHSRRRPGVRRLEWAAASPKTVAELFPFLRRHVVPALGHPPPKIGAMKTTASNAPEQNPAESQQSDSLPESDLPPSEQRRQQPIPQVHHDFAADEDK